MCPSTAPLRLADLEDAQLLSTASCVLRRSAGCCKESWDPGKSADIATKNAKYKLKYSKFI